MKVVALISGGKDSCYVMMRCLDYGHEIVALANLLPADDSVDELDSFMYQTVGHQVIVAYSQCMGLPLYRRRIQGFSRLQELRYIQTENDEVEDLFLLLKAVKNDFPDVDSVSCGAIASDYQRSRVENVCSRLGLVSLAFLWRQNQEDLLQQMITRGIHAIIVKVAAMGLNPQRHLGKNLAEMYPCLNQLHVRFGINVCGEGGEYETLTLDCPLFKNHRILLDEYEIVQHSADNIAPVGVLHPSKFHLECKDLQSFQPTPELCIKDVVTDMEKVLVCKNEDINVSLDFHEPVTRSKHGISFTSCSRESGDLAIYSSWTGSCKNNFGINEELGFVLDSIQEELEKTELSWGDVLYIHLYIDSMEAFASANEMYMQIITENACTNGVPSRSTVGVDLLESDSGRVLVEVIAAKKTKKKVLHVKSISCWAPNCIGPYSQATLSRGLLYMAGQLGLDPPTMRLVSGGPALEMEQALKNCEAVAEVFSTSTVNSSISILVYWSASIGILERQEAQASLSTFLSCDCSSSPDRAPVVHVQVRALPKGAAIEVEPFLYAPSCEESFNPSANLKRFRKGVHCEGTLIPGQLLRAFFSLPFNILVNNVNSASMVSAVDISSLASICTELKVCLQSFSDLLAEASFTWENVLALRILFASRAISRELILAAWNQATCYGPDSSTKNFSMECSISGVQSIQPLFVPVLCSGMDLNMNGLATLDLLALR